MKGFILLFGVPVFIISIVLLFRHYNNSSGKEIKQKTKNMEMLIKEGKQTQGIFDSTFNVLKIHGEEKQFSIDYHYTVNSKTYSDTKYYNTKNDIPTEQIFTVFYLEKDPTIHADNPNAELEKLNKKAKESSSPVVGWWLFCASTLGFIYVRWSNNKEKKRQQEFAELMNQN